MFYPQFGEFKCIHDSLIRAQLVRILGQNTFLGHALVGFQAVIYENVRSNKKLSLT